MSDLDITKNIRIIEKLKCELLSGVADLYENMLMSTWYEDERAEILAGIVINAYELAKRTGIDYAVLDESMIKRLKLAAVNNDRAVINSGHLLRHMERDQTKP